MITTQDTIPFYCERYNQPIKFSKNWNDQKRIKQ